MDKKVPLLGALTGFINEEQPADTSLSGATGLKGAAGRQQATSQRAEEPQASFSKKQPQSVTLDEETQVKLNFFNQMEAVFTEEQLNQVAEIIEQLICYPDQVPVIHELLYTSPPTRQEVNEDGEKEEEKEAA